MTKAKKGLILLSALLLFSSGCTLSDMLFDEAKKAGDKLGDEYVEFQDSEAAKVLGEKKEKSKELYGEMTTDLSEFQMKQIDEWILKNDLDQFGNKLGTIYSGGSPLEGLKGDANDRYHYILDNNPELKDTFKIEIKTYDDTQAEREAAEE